jgi:hypothetical protein
MKMFRVYMDKKKFTDFDFLNRSFIPLRLNLFYFLNV